MNRKALVLVAAVALHAGAGSAQNTSGNDAKLNVSISLDDASQSRAAVANLALPLEQEPRSLPVPPEQERRFRPADFARPNRLESLQIAVGDLPRGITAAAVRCQGFIGSDGSLGEYHCLADDTRRHERIVSAVIRAVRTQEFIAARVDGETVRVLMNFAIYVDCSSGSCLAVAARNHGYQIETLGLDYIEPQPILASDEWYEGFDYKLGWARSWMPNARDINARGGYGRGSTLPFVMAAEVDSDGHADEGCLYWLGITSSIPRLLELRTLWALESAVASFDDVPFVPGIVDGAPTRMRLYESAVTPWRFPEDGRGLPADKLECQ